MIKINACLLSILLSLGLTACGGGGGSGHTDNNNSTPIHTPPAVDLGQQPNLPPPSDMEIVPEPTVKFLHQLNVLDEGQSLNARDFGLTDWTPKSIASANDILYVANDSAAAKILRYDLKNKKALTQIDASQITGIGSVWNRLYDLSIYKDRLYTASLSSNRVDIFDIATGEPQLVMSLGTGSWNGEEHLAIVHALSVTANDDYVFAADIRNRINVWAQSDVSSSNHLKAEKYARLSLPGCGSIYCEVKLEATEQYLFASMNNGQTYIYDLSLIQKGDINVQPLQQKSLETHIYHSSDNGKLYAAYTSGMVKGFETKKLLKNEQILPDPIEQYQSYPIASGLGVSNLSKAKDMVVSNGRLLNLSQNNGIVILPLKQISAVQSNQAATTTELQQANALNQTKILKDGEPWSTLINAELRHFYVDKILSADMKKNELNLQSYSAQPVYDLEIHAKLKGTNQWFVLAKLDQLEAFSQLKFKVAVDDASRFALVDQSGSIQLQGLEQLNRYSNDLLDFKIISKTDTHVQKLSTIKAHWDIAFGDYGRNTDASWKRITPVYAREWVIMITNFAYLISSPEFEHIWFNYKVVMGDDFFGNAGRVNTADGYFSAADYEKYYTQIMNRGRINLGVTSMGGGLGGGSVLGIDTWIFYAHYFNTDIGIIGHEFGHHWGSHESAWAQSGYGMQPINQQLHQYFQRKQQLPYMDPNLNKFHLTPRAQLYNGVDENMRKPRSDSDVNYLERYFKNHPI